MIIVEAYPLRANGRAIPKSEISAGRVVGHFWLMEQYDPFVRRTLSVARIVDAKLRTNLIEPLHDARLVYANEKSWTITGWTKGGEVGHLQSWRMTLQIQAG